MKKIFLIAVSALFALSSCDDFLDSENYTEQNTGNYPSAVEDLNKELAALYGVMNQYAVDPLQTPWFVGYLMSDDANGGGGTGDVECHAISQLMSNKDALYEKAWHATYVGIARANAIIYSVDSFDWTGNESTRNQLLGEAYFMRGLYYLWGVQFWGNIPAYWAAAAPDPCPQVDAETVTFPHILADFVSAMNLMQHGATTQGDGHATKGAAEGYLARAYMFYEGFYKKAGELATANLADVELPEQEGVSGALTKAQVVSALEDCINNSGASLVSDFRLLWQYTNELTAPDYSYVSDLASAGTYWAGNGNSEQLFQVQFGNMASWNGTISIGFSNMTELYCSLRCDADANSHSNGGDETFPFGQGWGQGTINDNLYNDWSDSDPRKKATILNCEEELQDFFFTTSCSEETGYYNKKWITVRSSACDGTDGKQYTWWGVKRAELGAANSMSSFQGDHFSDIVLLRLADVMLMHSELTGTVTYMNKVRARAGLSDTTYSWTNIKNERRWELAGEGLRFNDLRRWSGKDGGESCEAAVAIERKNGSKVNYTGTWTTIKHASSSFAKRYAETDGFLPIPPAQIRTIDNPEVLTQNPGWGNDVSDWNMSGTPVY